MDANDDDDVRDTLAQARALLDFCAGHLVHEEESIHGALAQRGLAALPAIAEEHAEQHVMLAALAGSIAQVEQASGRERHAAALRLYRALALFRAENLRHMHDEEVEQQALLHACFSDGELAAILERLVACLSSAEMQASQRWMLPHLSSYERASTIAQMQRTAPPAAIRELLAQIRQLLSPQDWHKLMATLAPMPMAAVTVTAVATAVTTGGQKNPLDRRFEFAVARGDRNGHPPLQKSADALVQN